MEYSGNSHAIEEQEIHLRDILMVLSVRKWVVIIGALATIAGAIVYLVLSEPVYEAEVTMLYEKSNPTTALLDAIDFRQLQSELELDAQKAFLMSPIVLNEAKSKLLNEYGLILTDKEMEKILNLTSPRGSNVLKLTAKARTPATAALIANTVARVFIEKNAERKSSDLDRAISFLNSQLSQLQKRIQKLEEEIAKFKERERITAVPTQDGWELPGLLQKLGEMEDQLVQTELEYEQVKAQLEGIRMQIEEKKKELDPSVQQMTVAGGLTPQINELRRQITELKLELNSKLELYTEKHQDVIDLKQRLEAAEEQLRMELAKLAKVRGESLDPITEWQKLLEQETDLEVRLRGLEERKKLLEAKIKKFKEEHPDLVTKDVELMRMLREKKLLEATHLELKKKLEEMKLLKEMRSSDVTLIKEATEPRLPVKPKVKLTLALAVVLGVMFGVGLAFLLEYMDNTVKTKEEVERLTGLPVVGIIPKMEGKFLGDVKVQMLPSSAGGDGGPPTEGRPGSGGAVVKKLRRRYRQQLEQLLKRKITNLPPRSPIIESYRAIRSNIRYASLNGNIGAVKTILITSSLPGEGKSLTATNLAITFARSGVKTALVDCDLHRSKIHYMFNIDKSPGVSEFLTDQVEGETIEEKVSKILKPVDVENLYVIPSGKLPPNPGDLLASDKIDKLIEYLKSKFEMVIFDSPPLGVVSDTSVLATKIDATILIVRAGHTKRPVVAQAKEMLEHLGANVFGTVINELDVKSRRYSDYYYYYSYSKYGRSYYAPEEEEE